MNMDKDQTESRIEKTGCKLLEMFEAKSDSDQVQSTQEMTKSVRKRSIRSVRGASLRSLFMSLRWSPHMVPYMVHFLLFIQGLYKHENLSLLGTQHQHEMFLR